MLVSPIAEALVEACIRRVMHIHHEHSSVLVHMRL